MLLAKSWQLDLPLALPCVGARPVYVSKPRPPPQALPMPRNYLREFIQKPVARDKAEAGPNGESGVLCDI